RGDWYPAHTRCSRQSPLLADGFLAFFLDFLKRLQETIVLLRGNLCCSCFQLLRPLTDLCLGAIGVWFLDDQLLPVGPIGGERLDGLDDALAQDGSNGHSVSSLSIYRWLFGSILIAFPDEDEERGGVA